jgi:hypothetical protein
MATIAGLLGMLLAFSSMLLSLYVLTPQKKTKK